MTVRSESEAELLRAGARLLCENAVDGIAWLFRPEALSAATSQGGGRRVSRPTAARLWTDRTAAVVDVAHHVTDPDKTGASDGTEKVAETYRSVLAGGDATLDERKDAFRGVLRRTLARQLRSPHIPTGWMLHAAALTSSPLWEGHRPGEDLEEVGQRILDARSRLNGAVREHWTELLRDSITTYGRRLRPGVTVEKIAEIMQSLFNGFLLHIFMDPQINDRSISHTERQRRLERELDLLADAMWTIPSTYTTSPGLLDDPRQPADAEEARVFEQLITTAAAIHLGSQLPLAWPDQQRLVDPATAAIHAGLPVEAALSLFPCPSDLADSVLRWLVVPPARRVGDALIEQPLPAVRATLDRLQRAADTHPAIVEVARSEHPTRPAGTTAFLQDLVDALGEALRGAECGRDPLDTAQTLVDLALLGEAGWKGIEALLELLETDD